MLIKNIKKYKETKKWLNILSIALLLYWVLVLTNLNYGTEDWGNTH